MLRITRRAALAALGAAAAPASFSQPATAATGPLRLVVPFTPGTGIDLIARTVGPKLAERLGRPVVVDNRPGASGNIGTEIVVHSPPNESTLLVSVNTLVMNRSLYPKLPFDPVKDLVPVSLTSWGQLVLVANPRTGFKTAKDLVDAARRRPGKINYASPGVGTPHHLAMELFKATNHVFITHIPYRGTAPAVQDLIGGQVDVGFLPIHVALGQVRAGKLTALAIGSAKRHPLLPQVPTLEEAGAGKESVDMWYGVFAPAGTPPAFVQAINHDLHDILASSDVRTAFETQGMDPATSTPQEFGQLVAQDADRWARVIKQQGITAE
ncbi:MAG TPA: tripartite tricarboxylate transporter substrate binding protein [Ramlibacter sp.]|jgi:tripartite-type tricarboxylate transporter receptor subunit TctC